MDPTDAAATLLATRHAPEDVARWRTDLRERLLRRSRDVREPHFEALGPADLRLLVDGYDELMLGGVVTRLVAHHGASLEARVSRRLTSSAGCTRRKRDRNGGPDRYDVAVSAPLLFGTFRGERRSISVAGLTCADRLEALLLVLEHELVHLLEMLVWDASSCRRPRFRQLATSLFAHAETTHRLVTPRELADKHLGVRPGSVVSFEHAGRRQRGLVARITRRATVLVPDARGRLYTDGQRYQRYYVPLDALSVVHPPARKRA